MYTDRRKPWIHRMLLWILGLLPERRTNLVLWDCGEFSMDVRDNINSDFRYDSFGRLKGLSNHWYRYSIREMHRFRKACERYYARDYNHRHYASLFPLGGEEAWERKKQFRHIVGTAWKADHYVFNLLRKEYCSPGIPDEKNCKWIK